MKEKINYFEYLKDLELLYVEDDTLIREELEFFLKKIVKKLYIATNGKEGYALYKDHKPDIVITDIKMPVMDGIEMSKLIKSFNSNAKIIVITSFNDADFLFEAIKLNLTSYLTKPLDLLALSKKLYEISKTISLGIQNDKNQNLLSQYKKIIDISTIVSKGDKNGIITYVNDAFIKISGYKEEELLGQHHNIVRHDDVDKETYVDLWNTIKIKKKTWSGKIKNKTKSGDAYYVNAVITPILDENGEILEYMALRSLITDSELAKEYYKKQYSISSDKFEDIFSLSKIYENALDQSNIIMRLDLNKNITYINDEFKKITGYKEEDLLHKSYLNLNYIGDDTILSEMWNEVENGNIWKGTISNKAKDGKIYYSLTTLVPLKNKDNKILEYMSIRQDISDVINLHKELEDTQREIIYKLGEIGETRSKETGFHVKRVAKYSYLFAIKMGLTEEEAKVLEDASPMHDIGKIGIPDYILNKPGALTTEEFIIMKTHAEIGFEMLRGSNRKILKASEIVAYEHHEKWDGSGYPRGLKGTKIHIYGRITAICDVFDALGSDRCYKKAWPLDKILDLFKRERAKHFDPLLVDIFFENLDEFLLIKNKYK